jgi:hypothetical protein
VCRAAAIRVSLLAAAPVLSGWGDSVSGEQVRVHAQVSEAQAIAFAHAVNLGPGDVPDMAVRIADKDYLGFAVDSAEVTLSDMRVSRGGNAGATAASDLRLLKILDARVRAHRLG